MKRWLLLSILVAGCATGKATTVESAHAERFRLMTANDLRALSDVLAPDVIYVHSDATVEDKQQFLASLRNGRMRYRYIEPVETKVKMEGPVAIVTGLAKVGVTLNGNDNRDVSLLYTAVYTNVAGRWLLTSWQSTRVP